MSNRCMICAKGCDDSYSYHERCARAFFGTWPAPALEVTLARLQEYAATTVLSRVTVTGVQKKLSLGLERKGRDARLTVVGLWGRFILKPPVDEYPFLPENEFTVMQCASAIGISCVPFGMIALQSGETAFISRRIDRSDEHEKIAMEDFCQVSGRLTEDKYRGSVERIGKLLKAYSVFPGLDAVNLFELTVFNYLVGNADMHLKNYSLVETPQGMRLSPAYDLVSTVLAIPDDPEESALTINGKKAKLTREDLEALAENLGVRENAAQNSIDKLTSALPVLNETISRGPLPAEMQAALAELIEKRARVLAS